MKYTLPISSPAIRVSNILSAFCAVATLYGCAPETPEEPPEDLDMGVGDMISADLSERTNEDMAEAVDLGSCHALSCPDGSIFNAPDHLWFFPANEFTLAPQLLDEDGEVIEGVTFEFESGDPGRVEVDALGQLRTLAVGDVTVTVRAGGLMHETRVHVDTSVPGVGYRAEIVGEIGETATLAIERFDLEKFEDVIIEAEFTSMDESIATVDRTNGLVELVGEGETTIVGEGRYQGETMACKIKVASP